MLEKTLTMTMTVPWMTWMIVRSSPEQVHWETTWVAPTLTTMVTVTRQMNFPPSLLSGSMLMKTVTETTPTVLRVTRALKLLGLPLLTASVASMPTLTAGRTSTMHFQPSILNTLTLTEMVSETP